MSTSHCDDPCMSRDQIVATVMAIPQQLERTALLNFLEHILEIAVATLRDLQICLVRRAREERLRGVREELPEGEEQGHHRAAPRLQRRAGLLHLYPGLLGGARAGGGRGGSLALWGRRVAAGLLPLPGGPAVLQHLLDGGAVAASDTQLLLELLPARLHVVQEEVLRILAGVRGVLPKQAKRVGQPLDLGQEVQPPLQHVVHAAPLGEILLHVEFLDTTAQPEKVPLWDVEGDDLLEEIVQRLVRVRHQHHLLVWEVVEEQVHHLDGRVRLPGAGRADHHREPRVDARPDGFNLHRREAHGILVGLALRVRAHVRQLVGRDRDALRGALARLGAGDLFELDPVGLL
mmetsp:Transcript_97305/g.271707  ORF Transcript_97305/g.271707 Transcript_97305/m.271707 type:complete len:347 (+) Transcript_97305:1131-2171(+)